MPPSGPPKNTKTQPNLVVTVKYEGLKATQFFSKYTTESYRQLMNDLRVLGLPHPKKSNIVFISHGTLEFFWPVPANDKGVFASNLFRKVNLSQEGQVKSEQIAFRKELSITSLTVRKQQNYDPYLENQSKSLPSLKNPATSHGHRPGNPYIHLTAERFHPYPRPIAHNNGHHFLNPFYPVYNNPALFASTSQALPDAPLSEEHVGPGFLDDMEISPEPPGNPKSKSVSLRMSMSGSPLYTHTSGPSVKREHLSPSLTPFSAKSSNNGGAQEVPHHPDLSNAVDTRVTTGFITQLSGPTPKATYLPTISRLISELYEVRDKVATAIERESSILEELRRLDPSFRTYDSLITGNNLVTKIQLQKIEMELESERAKRLEMEAVLKDVERECREPFVVPALLETFAKISQTTTAAVRHAHTHPAQNHDSLNA